ncbi:MAG: hypothetical protein KF802_06305 [Bdellovibrionaceae bacterium]|nr:hypothetical protein [Pseudobdellovibrionaceae bacterium]MBX3032534.1 hypothetical protein [Pseudobdellovibrionaceae bacterium]
MKRFFQLLAVFALPALLAACPGKNNDNEDSAATPLNTQCLYGQVTGCTPGMYGQFPGFYPYPVPYSQYQGGYYNYWYSYSSYYGYPNSGSMGFCDCGPNGYPVYNNNLGLGCVQRQMIAPIATVSGYWSLPAVNNTWSSIPQVSNIPNNGVGACQNNFLQACFLSAPNSCAAGYVCAPTSGGSALGICTRRI